MNSNWKDYFYFTKAERNGIALLLLLCLFLLILPFFFPFFRTSQAVDFSAFQEEVKLLLSVKDKPNKSVAPTKTDPFPFDPNTVNAKELTQLGLPQRAINNLLNYRKKGGRFYRKQDLQKIYGLPDTIYQKLADFIILPTKKKKDFESAPSIKTASPSESGSLSSPPTLKPFDPNTATQEDLLSLGLSPKVSNTLINFRKKGGTFRKKGDLKKVFGISEAQYQTLEPYIQLPEQSELVNRKTDYQSGNAVPSKRTKEKMIVDVNQASAEEWQAIRGIGPYYAKRITQWREELGGFSNIEQIGETFGLPDSTFQQIRPQLQLSSVLRKIELNQATVETLKTHPYLNYRQSQALVNYRNNHGPFRNWKEVEKVKALSPETLTKIKPYFSLD